jgi:hypothetical protein
MAALVVQAQHLARQTVVAVVAVLATALLEVRQVQAAPALLSSSTPYHHKRYLRSKALLLGNARQVLLALTIL